MLLVLCFSQRKGGVAWSGRAGRTRLEPVLILCLFVRLSDMMWR